MREEYAAQMAYFNKSFDNVFRAAETVHTSATLANVMLHICKTGNFINDVGIYSSLFLLCFSLSFVFINSVCVANE